jgi:hypothetical protein
VLEAIAVNASEESVILERCRRHINDATMSPIGIFGIKCDQQWMK